MKKILMIIAALVITVPVVAQAKTEFSADTACYTTELSVGQSKTCVISATVDSPATGFEITIAPTNSEYATITSIKPRGSWSGNNVGGKITLTSATPQTGTFELFEYTVRLEKATTNPNDCSVLISATNVPSKTIPVIPTVCDPNTECCPGDTHETNPLCPQNPDTGSFVSYAVVGAGLLIAASVYLVAKKRNKFYKI